MLAASSDRMRAKLAGSTTLVGKALLDRKAAYLRVLCACCVLIETDGLHM